MGLYVRKSVKIGPVRLNVSKSGVGASVGVKGARVSVNPKGKVDLHAGRGGLYYRQRVGQVNPNSGPASILAIVAVLIGGFFFLVVLLFVLAALLGSSR